MSRELLGWQESAEGCVLELGDKTSNEARGELLRWHGLGG